MSLEKPRSIPRDLLAGFVAIVFVVGTAIRAQFVGSDLRVLFAITGTAFFLAGLVRGLTAPQNPWIKAFVASSPGLLGTAALIMNDGLHRVQIPIAISLTAILLTFLGIQSRRLWHAARIKGILTGIFSTGALAGLSFFLVPTLVVYSSLKSVNKMVREFSLSASDGNVIKSGDLRGRVAILAFWATWCLPCHWELPELETASRTFNNNPQVAFWAVDADWGEESPEKARVFLAKRKLAIPWAFDSGGAARALGVDSLPTVVLMDAQGRVRMTHYGYDASEHLDTVITRAVQDILAGKP